MDDLTLDERSSPKLPQFADGRRNEKPYLIITDPFDNKLCALTDNMLSSYIKTTVGQIDIKLLKRTERPFDLFNMMTNKAMSDRLKPKSDASYVATKEFMLMLLNRRGAANITKDDVCGLIPVDLSDEEYVEYRDKCIAEIIDMNTSFLKLITTNYGMIGEVKSIINRMASEGITPELVTAFDRIIRSRWDIRYDDRRESVTYDLRNPATSHGVVIINTDTLDIEDVSPSKLIARVKNYDYTIISHGRSDVKSRWECLPVTINGVRCTVVDDIIREARKDGAKTICLLICNQNVQRPADADGVHYGPYGSVLYENAIAKAATSATAAHDVNFLIDMMSSVTFMVNHMIDCINHMRIANTTIPEFRRNRIVVKKDSATVTPVVTRNISSTQFINEACASIMDLYDDYTIIMHGCITEIQECDNNHFSDRKNINDSSDGYLWLESYQHTPRPEFAEVGHFVNSPRKRFSSYNECVADLVDYAMRYNPIFDEMTVFGVMKDDGSDNLTTISDLRPYDLLGEYVDDSPANLSEAIASTESIDRQEKERLANKYELRDVGNTHAQEDAMYADIEEYKRRNAARKKQYAKEHAKDLKLKYLKKANRVRKRKRLLRKIKKAVLPGVKNEDVGSVDNTDTESREVAEIRQDDIMGGSRKRYFDNKVQYADASTADDGPVIIESSVKIQFPETAPSTEGSIEPIDVAFFGVNGKIQQIAVLNCPELKALTVIRNPDGSSKARLRTGTAIESKLYKNGQPFFRVYLVFPPAGGLETLRKRLGAYVEKKATFTVEGIDDLSCDQLCGRLIRDLIGLDFGDTLDVKLLHVGNAFEIDKKELTRKAELMIAEKNLLEKIQEGAKLNLHPENPYQDLILEYKLSQMGNDYVNYLVEQSGK